MLPPSVGEQVLVGLTAPDDAGVFQLTPEIALVQTVDFFTPIVDDPYCFGQIAAANALSDIYAMGGKPLTAMNVACFPCSLGMELLSSIFNGGRSKVEEAGAVLLGGHTVEDKEPKYGLSVTGILHPDHILSLQGAGVGDALIITKPLGTGILATALKGGLIGEDEMAEAITAMATLNMSASKVALQMGVTACTDVTGFGFLGHLAEMLTGSNLSCLVYSEEVPIYAGAREMAEMGLVPGGTARNREYLGGRVNVSDIDSITADLLFDAQTSGGLLFALPKGRAQEAIALLTEAKTPAASVVGEFVERGDYDIIVR